MNIVEGALKGPAPIGEKKHVLWPSKLDLTELCSASQHTEDIHVVIDHTNDSASLGVAVHDIASKVVLGERVTTNHEDLQSIAVRHGVDHLIDDVAALTAASISAWETLKKYFRNPVVEQSSSVEVKYINPHTGEDVIVVLSGKHDVCELFDVSDTDQQIKKWAVNLDWKTGYKSDESSYRSQMLAYAYLLISKDPDIEQVTTIIAWLRDRTYSSTTFKRQEIVDWFDNFLRRSAFWDGKTYSPGDHCLFCKRFYVCPARITMASSAIELFQGKSGREAAPMILNPDGSLVDPEKLYLAYQQGKTLEKMLKRFFTQVKEEVIKRGKIPVGKIGESEFGFYTKKRRGASKIDPLKAWGILEEAFTEEEIAALIDISVSKIREAAMNKASYGNKSSAADALINKLKDANAVIAARDSISVHDGEIEESDSDG